MAPDGMEDYIHIHSAFLSTQDGELLLNLHNTVSSGDLPEVVVQIGRWPEETAAGGSSEEKVEEESSLQEKDEGKSRCLCVVCHPLVYRSCPNCHCHSEIGQVNGGFACAITSICG